VAGAAAAARAVLSGRLNSCQLPLRAIRCPAAWGNLADNTLVEDPGQLQAMVAV
jgi:hypothetical protein